MYIPGFLILCLAFSVEHAQAHAVQSLDCGTGFTKCCCSISNPVCICCDSSTSVCDDKKNLPTCKCKGCQKCMTDKIPCCKEDVSAIDCPTKATDCCDTNGEFKTCDTETGTCRNKKGCSRSQKDCSIIKDLECVLDCLHHL